MTQSRLALSVSIVVVAASGCLAACGSNATPSASDGSGGSYQVLSGGGGPSCIPGGEFACGSGGAYGTGGMMTGAGGELTGAGGAGGAIAGTGGTATAVGAGGAGSGEPTPVSCTGCTEQLCAGANVVNIPVTSFKPCSIVGCNDAHCVPAGAIPAKIPLDLLTKCEDATTVCVPDDYIATYGQFLAKKCSSILGAEGRCISTCIGQVNGLMDALPKDVCGDSERCAPCVNPNDGKDTGACLQGCDPGKSAEADDPKYMFAMCAHGEGRCVQKSIIPQALLSQLVQNPVPGEAGCPNADEVCAPVQKSQNLKYNFPKCAPGNPFTGAAAGILCPAGPSSQSGGAPQAGGCVPSWLADSNPIEGIFLEQDTCGANQKCAPCENPLRFCAATGACPVALPSDPSGGMPPDSGQGGAAGSGGGSSGGSSGASSSGAGGVTGSP